MNIFGTVNRSRAFDFRVRRQSLFDQAVHLLFVSSMPFHCLDNQAMG